MMSAPPPIPTRTWCIFRNLVHAVYREACHLGPHNDTEARIKVGPGRFLEAARLCRKHRSELKSCCLHSLTAQARTPAEVLRQYQDSTGLSVDHVIAVFRLPGWRPSYGGKKWAEIAETLKELVTALENSDDVKAAEIAEAVTGMHHNSGRLVPTRSEWEQSAWLQEKWPEFCD
jgi:hypothetical protein